GRRPTAAPGPRRRPRATRSWTLVPRGWGVSVQDLVRSAQAAPGSAQVGDDHRFGFAGDLRRAGSGAGQRPARVAGGRAAGAPLLGGERAVQYLDGPPVLRHGAPTVARATFGRPERHAGLPDPPDGTSPGTPRQKVRYRPVPPRRRRG